jgi:hypothetical protein
MVAGWFFKQAEHPWRTTPALRATPPEEGNPSPTLFPCIILRIIYIIPNESTGMWLRDLKNPI